MEDMNLSEVLPVLPSAGLPVVCMVHHPAVVTEHRKGWS